MSTFGVPSELIYPILTAAISESMYALCTSPEAPTWELQVVAILSSVSFTFNNIVKDVITKAFAIPPPLKGGTTISVLPIVRDRLRHLRALGAARLYGDPPPSRGHVGVPPFIHAHSLYVASLALRRRASECPVDVFLSTHKSIQLALSLAQGQCKLVRPKGMTETLSCAIESDMSLVQSGISIVRPCLDLEDSLEELSRYETQDELATPGMLSPLKDKIHESLRNLETGGDQISIFLSDPLYRVFQFPRLIKAIHKCAEFSLDLDEYDITKRAGCLATAWQTITIPLQS